MEKEFFFKIVSQKVSPDNENTEQLSSIVDEFPYFQVAKVLFLKNLKETSHPDFDTALKKTAVSVPDRKKLYRFLNTRQPVVIVDAGVSDEDGTHTEVDAKNSDENQSKNSLIEKFLSTDIGRISRNPETEEDEQDVENEVVKKSVEEDNEIVTETLATIYLQQKKYDKALHAFRKLSLKYPEKSVYFASRIKEIEELKNI